MQIDRKVIAIAPKISFTGKSAEGVPFIQALPLPEETRIKDISMGKTMCSGNVVKKATGNKDLVEERPAFFIICAAPGLLV